MRGEGPFADLLAQRFSKTVRRLRGLINGEGLAWICESFCPPGRRNVIDLRTIDLLLSIGKALAGMGVLIVLSQVRVILDAAPKPLGLDNLADPALLIAAFAVAFIASAETLLSRRRRSSACTVVSVRISIDELSAQGDRQHALRPAWRVADDRRDRSQLSQCSSRSATTRYLDDFPWTVAAGVRDAAVERAAKHSGGESAACGVHRVQAGS